MITLETLEKWLNAPAEIERLEFKEAKQQFTLRGVEGFDTTKLLNQQKSVLTQIEVSHSQNLKPFQNKQKSVLTQIELLLDIASASMSPNTSPYYHLKSCYRLNCKKRSPYSRRRLPYSKDELS